MEYLLEETCFNIEIHLQGYPSFGPKDSYDAY